MASLTGQTIASTYDALLKITDNGPITASLKQITDGLGNNTPLYLSATTVFVDGNFRAGGAFYDGNNSAGTAGQFLVSTGTGVDWQNISESNLISGTGTNGFISKFTASGVIADSVIQESGSNIGIGISPTQKLHVSGNGLFTGTITASNVSGSNTGDETKASIESKLGAATSSNDGYLTAANWTTFNAKQNQLNGTGFVKATGTTISYDNSVYALESRAINTSAPLSGGGNLSANRTISIAKADAVTDGYLAADDFANFNSKVPASRTITINGETYDLSANRTYSVNVGVTSFNTRTGAVVLSSSDVTTALGYTPALESRIMTINGVGYSLAADRSWSVGTVTSVGTSAPLTGGTITGAGTIGITQANASTDGYLSSTDWNTFNNKQAALGFTPENVANKGAANGYASLDGAGKVPSIQLPSYVDDVVEVANFAALPATGETGKIYITLDTNFVYRWSGSVYVKISEPNAVWGSITGTLSNQTDLQSALNAKVDNTRTLTINGVTSDLSANRTFNVGTVTSVSGTGSVSGLSLSGSVIGSGSLTLGGTLSLTSSDVTTGLGYTPVTNARTLSINGTAFDLTANRSWNVGTVTSVGLELGTTGTDANIANSPITSSGNITLNLPTASATNRGLLSAANWTTFNNKQNAITLTTTGNSGSATFVGSTLNIPTYTLAGLGGQPLLTNPVTGTGTSGYLTRFTGSTTIGNSVIFDNGSQIGIGTASPAYTLHVAGQTYINPLAGYNVLFQNSGTTLRMNYLNDAGSANVSAAYRATDFAWQKGDGAETMRITSGGAVGIGTTTPTSRLSVWEGEINISNLSSGFTTPMAGVSAFNNDASNGGLILKTATSNSLTEKVRITSGGRVGINTTAPVGRLGIGAQEDLLSTGGITLGPDDSSIEFLGSNFSLGYGLKIYQSSERALSIAGRANSTTWTNHLTVLDTGNVGIGLTNPSLKLQVIGDIGTSTRLVTDTINGYTGGGTPITIQTGGAQDVVIGTNATERMRITSGGNVGIGLSNPAGKAQIFTDRYNDSLTFNDPAGFIIGGSIRQLSINSNDTSPFSMSMQAKTNGNTAASLVLQAAGGNVGIGVVNPTDGKLCIGGVSQLATTIAQTYFGVAAYSQWVTSSGAFAMGLDGAAGTTERMRITSGGDVGIGSTNPAHKLQVVGSIASEHGQGTISMRAVTGLLEMHVRPNQGNNAYITFTENAVADRWSIGVSAGDSNFYFRYPYTSSTSGASIATNGTYSTLSDVNKKKDFEASNIGLNEIMMLKPTLYRMKYDSDSEAKQLGFIAQEVKEVIPYAYTESGSGEDKFIGLTDRPIIAALVKAIQEQQVQIEELKAKLK